MKFYGMRHAFLSFSSSKKYICGNKQANNMSREAASAKKLLKVEMVGKLPGNITGSNRADHFVLQPGYYIKGFSRKQNVYSSPEKAEISLASRKLALTPSGPSVRAWPKNNMGPLLPYKTRTPSWFSGIFWRRYCTAAWCLPGPSKQ